MLVHLLRYKLLGNLKAVFDAGSVSLVRGIGSFLLFGAFGYTAYAFSLAATRFLLERTHTGLYLFHSFISMILFVLFVAVNLGNIIVSYSTLYRSAEVGYLLTKPIAFTTIFVLKFLDNFFYSSTTLFLVAFAALLGYGTYFGYPWYFFVVVMVCLLLPFMFLSACLAVMVLMAIMKAAGRVGFRTVMGGLFVLYFVSVYFFFDVSNPIAMVAHVNRYSPQLDSYLSRVSPRFMQYLPNQWVAESLYHVARGDLPGAVSQTGILLAVTTGAFVVCVLVARRFYYRSWLISLHVQSSGQAPGASRKKKILDFRSNSILPAPIEALVKKEFFTFFRESSQWIHLAVMMVLTGLFVVSVSHLNLDLRLVDPQTLTYLTLFAFGGFMVCSLALRFVFPMIGLEGRAWWVIRTSPINVEKVYAVKFAIGFILVLVVAEFIAIASNIPFVRITELRPLLFWFGLFSAFWISLATVAVNLGMGAYFANFLERNPIRAASTQGATLTFLVTIVYLMLLVAVILFPLSAYFASLFRFKYFNMSAIILPGTLFGVISYLFTAAGVVLGLRAVRRDF